MIRFVSTEITFREAPDEICRSFSISNCGLHCIECHSAHLQEDIGIELTKEILIKYLIKDKNTVTCYVFLGEGKDKDALKELLQLCKDYGYKTCIYTGHNTFDVKYYYGLIDYLKTGPYIAQLGGLDSVTTNQKFYHITYDMNTKDVIYKDMTYRFLKTNS